MKIFKNKNIKWWVGRISFMILFLIIGVFSYMKTDFLRKGVQITDATINIDQTSTSSITRVSGNAKNAIYLSLNGREIFIDKDGTFNEPISLLSGLSIVTIDAQDKFGKTAEKKFEIIYNKNMKTVALKTPSSAIININ